MDTHHIRGAGRFAVLALCASGLAACSGGLGCGDTGIGPCGKPPTIKFGLGLAVADFDGDGRPDVATNLASAYNDPGEIDVYLHASATGLGYDAPLTTPAVGGWSDLVAGDVYGDGYPDVVAADSFSNLVAVFHNDPAHPGHLLPPVTMPSVGANHVVIADIDGDGVPDLLVADQQLSLFVQDATTRGSFQAPVALYPAGAGWVAVGDLNGDGVPDIALADAVGVKVLFHSAGTPGAGFEPPVSVWTQSVNSSAQGVNVVAVADVDGDGLTDLVITDPGPTGSASALLVVLLQDRNHPGSFLPPATYSIPLDAGSLGTNIVVSDLNGDGHPDIVIGGQEDVTVLLQDAAQPGRFLPAAIYQVPLGADTVQVADVNGDGRPDLVVVSGATNSETAGVISGPPGVLLQDPAHPGSFLPIQNLR